MKRLSMEIEKEKWVAVAKKILNIIMLNNFPFLRAAQFLISQLY